MLTDVDMSLVFFLVLWGHFNLESCVVAVLRCWLLPPMCSSVFHIDSPPELTSFSPAQGPTRSGLG